MSSIAEVIGVDQDDFGTQGEFRVLRGTEGDQFVETVTVPYEELASFLNTREQSLAAKLTPATLQRTIAVDFDGTLFVHRFPDIGPVQPGAKEALALFRKLGYRVIIWTCRTCHWNYDVFGGDPSTPTLERPHVQEMIQRLKDEGIEYDEIDDGSRGKPLASLYIDDKGIAFRDNWPEIAEFVERVRPQ